jgi:hypothetical protein
MKIKISIKEVKNLKISMVIIAYISNMKKFWSKPTQVTCSQFLVTPYFIRASAILLPSLKICKVTLSKYVNTLRSLKQKKIWMQGSFFHHQFNSPWCIVFAYQNSNGNSMVYTGRITYG